MKNNNINIKIFIGNMIFFLVFMNNFKIFSIGGRGVLLQEVLILSFIIVNLKKIQIKKNFYLLLIIMVIPLLGIINIINLSQFMLTYISLLFYLAFLIVLNSTKNELVYLKYFNKGLNVLAIYGVIQFLYASFVHPSEFIHVPWGGNAAITTYFTQINGFYRSNSLFYEPSIFGLYCSLGLALNLTFKELRSKFSVIINILAVLCSLSGSAYICLILILIANFIIKQRNIFIKYISFIFIIFSYFIIHTAYLGGRLSELFVEGTTAYYRIIAPLRAIYELVLKKYILGIGLGQIELYLKKSNFEFMKVYETTYTSVDNIPSVIIFYFGLIGIIILILFLKYLLKNINKKNILVVISFIILSLGTGAINYIYFIMAFAILILTLKISKGNIKNE